MNSQNEPLKFDFNQEVAIEIILYLIKQVEKLDLFSLCKLLYFAEKIHLENWGSSLCGEPFVAMKNGPVPSRSYDLLKGSRQYRKYGFQLNNNKIIAFRPPNMKRISPAAKETLDRTVSKYASVQWQLLRKYSHDQAWQKAWDSRGDNQSILMPLETVVSELPDAENLLLHVRGEGV